MAGWTRDGRIVFTVLQWAGEGDSTNLPPEVWIMDADGANARQVDGSSRGSLKAVGCVDCPYPLDGVGPGVHGLLETRAVRLLVGVAAVLFAACGSASPSGPPPSESSEPIPSGAPATAAAASTAPADLVGEWERETRCEEIVAALQAAGLEKWIVEVAAGFVPGAEGPEAVEDPADPCRDAVPLRHSHFFTADGQFGSRDQDGNQVDDGTYRIVDEGTFVVSKEFPDVTFHYSIDGDSITFEPVDPRVQP